MRLFLLGAGFSKAAGLPLTTTLTDLLIEHHVERGAGDDFTNWAKALRETIPLEPGHSIDIETFFHYARLHAEIWRARHHVDPVGRTAGDTCWQYAEDIETWLGYLEHDLVEVIRRYDKDADLGPYESWAHSVRENDVIVSLNYDTVVERALNGAGRSWHHGLNDVCPDAHPILKLHGSLDWILGERGAFHDWVQPLFRKKDVNLEEDLNPERRGVPEYDVELGRVPLDRLDGVIDRRWAHNATFGLAGLGASKMISAIPGLGLVWARAQGGIKDCHEVIAIGLSLSPFDALLSLALREAVLRREEGTPVRVVSPNAHELAHRFRDVFGEQVDSIDETFELIDWELF